MKPILTVGTRWVAAALVIALAACETPSPEIQYPEITFTNKKPIRLDVLDVEFVQKYVPKQAPPYVEHRFPVQPAAVVERWTKDRLEPVGIARRARVILIDAGVTETVLRKREGIRGFFWNDQSERYDTKVEVRVEIVDDDGVALAYAHAVARRSRSVPEDISLSEREQVWFEFTEDVMKALDVELERSIRRYLVRFVR